ncbi:unnamed protein product [Zymoseptoria tritici ST99CH_3D1]|uniref:Uncharacterized protein n=1 Tax=Zymoseptoria tritici ST99CH_1E4 TaxID=1276532 RepID=A0A2H1H9J3_ZYMTR|nr:unnamed protein product [Zymoseptoria tritici ST99CH_1E4]SMR64890.1 unnamed protein product [Zymoseptoria tritici ST99CH_3D1]
MEDIVKKITTIEDKEQQNKENWERASDTQRSLLKRIEDVERNLQEYARALKKLGEEMDAGRLARRGGGNGSGSGAGEAVAIHRCCSVLIPSARGSDRPQVYCMHVA